MSAWWDWMVGVSAQVAVLVTVILATELVCGRFLWPQLRAALWALVPLRLVVPPWIASPVSIAGLAPESSAAVADAAPSQPTGAFVIWLAGVSVALFLLVSRYRRLRSACKGPRAPRAIQVACARLARDLRIRTPEVRIVDALRSPAVFGIWRPVVVLPRDLLPALDGPRLEHVLLHELTHIRRFDPLTGLLCTVIRVAYWLHPLVWLACRREETLREICCDDAVTAAIDDVDAYRHTLLELACGRGLEPGLPFMRRRSQTLVRLRSLARPVRSIPAHRPRLRGTVTLALLTLVFACCMPCADAPLRAPGIRDQADVDALEGCMQRRFLVFGLLAASDD